MASSVQAQLQLDVEGSINARNLINVFDGPQAISLKTNEAENYVQLDAGGVGHSGDKIVIGGLAFPFNNAIMMGNVGLGTTSPDQKLHVLKGSAGTIDANPNSIAVLENSTVGFLNILTPDNIESGLLFGQPTLGTAAGGILFDANFADGLEFRTGGNMEHLIGIDASGNMGIGTSTPQAKLHILEEDPVMYIQDKEHFSADAQAFLKFSESGDSQGNTTETTYRIGYDARKFTLAFSGFDTDYANLLTVLEDGKVGIGTDAPDSKLLLANFGSNDGLKMLGFGEGETSSFWFGSGFAPSGGDNYMSLSTIFTTDAMTWKLNGNVGIGTTDPQFKLDVVGAAKATSMKVSAQPTIAGQGTYLGWNRDGSTGKTYLGCNKGLGSGGFEFVIYNNDDSFDKIPMTISGEGNVGIGTTDYADGHLLSVGGKIACEEVRVQLENDWPDYVFQKDYELPSLEAVERHIQKEQHLPGIPSAATVQKEGIMVADMQAKLLEKIEELTLYTIEQDKQIKLQQKQLNELTVLLEKAMHLIHKK